MKNLLFLSLFVLAATARAETYDFTDRLGVGGGGGYTFPIQGNTFDEFAEEEAMWNAHIRYNLTPASGLQLNYSQLEFQETDISAGVMDLMYLYRSNEGDRMTPIFGLGAGVADMGDIEPYDDNLKFASRARAGFEFALTGNFLASLFVDYQFIGKMPFTDDKANALPGTEIFALIPQAGLTYFFGPEKEIEKERAAAVVAVNTSQMDDDKDGIMNEKDKCPGTEAGLTVNAYGCLPEEKASMTLEVLFPTGSAKLGDEANAPLDELAAFLNEHPKTKIEIQGHTDNTGSKKLNKKLSDQRANSVRTYLVEKAGILPSRVSAYGYGDEQPIGDNTTTTGREKNRRVIGVITQ